VESKYRELSAVLQVITPILGSIIDYDARVGRFHRSPENGVIIMPGWWRQTVDFGAKAVGRGQSQARDIRFAPVVKCEVTQHRRYTTDDSYIDHEAIERVCVISLSTPVGLQVETVRDILNQGGRFVGIAPFRWHVNYGRFEVVDIGQEGDR